MKKLIFVLILLFSIDITHRLLLLLPFTWFKSEVKDTVVEPVVIVEKKQITGFKSEVKDTVVEPVVQVEKRQTGVLFERKFNGKWGWYENGDENRDGKYVGEIALGKPNGLGTYDFSNGDRYEGEWRGGRRHGNGTYTYQDGSKYVGEWKNNINHGRGTFTSADGRKFVGEFKENKFWNIEQINKNGDTIKKWINGKKQ